MQFTTFLYWFRDIWQAFSAVFFFFFRSFVVGPICHCVFFLAFNACYIYLLFYSALVQFKLFLTRGVHSFIFTEINLAGFYPSNMIIWSWHIKPTGRHFFLYRYSHWSKVLSYCEFRFARNFCSEYSIR